MKDVLLIIASRTVPASYEDIARAAGCSRSAVAYTVQHAIDLGILERFKTRVMRSGRWVNGRNRYQILKKALSEKLPLPWRRSDEQKSSKSKFYPTGNQEFKKQREKRHSVQGWLDILTRMDAGMSAKEAGYHSIE
ncbi:hypothetical protein JK207_16040 [Gluconobacter cerinus]|uniref:hypothetical protein n=1 Tax=Gluconobacter cerinus TaxID=38307 RepID=UPI001B8B3540|nr:hypothetical protein [Gluconobacter cerinus]MBS1023502.1 hypothetical protein [Gluconobacter cerinus]